MKKSIILIVSVICIATLFAVLVKPANKRQTVKQLDKHLIVSILPLKYLVERIVSDSFIVDVLVPSGASPETYEPTPQQMVAISGASLIFTTGLLDFEREIVAKIGRESTANVVDLSMGIGVIAGSCSGSEGSHHGHNHGTDPHIWLSPVELKVMAGNILSVMMQQHPDLSEEYENRYTELLAELDDLDAGIRDMISRNDLKYVLIYHPALTYYSKHYNLEQIAIEQEGKEPSVEQLQALVTLARSEGIKKVLYQREFNDSVIKTIAEDIGAEPVVFDPLAEDVIANLDTITRLITDRK